VKSLIAGLRLLRLRFHWDQFARRDPLWAVLTAPDKKGGGWTPEEFFRRGELEIAALEALLRERGLELRGRRALDFGCGVGRVTGPLADRFDEAVGVDISPKMLELARGYNRRGERCRFVQGEADLRRFDDASFDFAYSKLVLQHMNPAEVRGYLPELLRVLRPGGLLAFQLPEPIDDRGRGWKGGIPLPLLRGLRRLRRLVTGKVQFPRMDLHGMPRADVLLRMIAGAGAAVIHVAPDQSHGDDSQGFLYVVRKPAEAG
jgi:SAM-dependent methyltransferase